MINIYERAKGALILIFFIITLLNSLHYVMHMACSFFYYTWSIFYYFSVNYKLRSKYIYFFLNIQCFCMKQVCMFLHILGFLSAVFNYIVLVGAHEESDHIFQLWDIWIVMQHFFTETLMNIFSILFNALLIF